MTKPYSRKHSPSPLLLRVLHGVLSSSEPSSVLRVPLHCCCDPLSLTGGQAR